MQVLNLGIKNTGASKLGNKIRVGQRLKNGTRISDFLLFGPIGLIIYLLFFSFNFLFDFSTPNSHAAPLVGASTLSMSINTPSVDLDFTPTGSAAQFIESGANLTIQTDNRTGVTTYVASIDENTDLKHTDATIAQKLSSISSTAAATAFSDNNWGYRVTTPVPPGSDFLPIPKASAPDTIFSTPNATGSPYAVGISFGAKVAANLISGTYKKDIIFTTITNFVPKTATFLPGPNFNFLVKKINPAYNTENFKRANSQPANLSSAKVVSTADSDYPIYVWYEAADKTVYWWSEADVAYANEDAREMFSNLSDGHGHFNLVDVSGIDMSKTKNASYMFHSGNYLYKNIILGDFNSENVEDMSYMFASNSSSGSPTSEVDFSRFKTSNVQFMRHMFEGNFAQTLNLSSFDTSKVEDMSEMFAKTKNLTTVNLSSFNTSNVKDMKNMFRYASAVTSLNLSSFDTREVTNMRSMFAHMKALTNLNISSFRTPKVTDMSGMFLNMEKVTSLDLSRFDTSKVTNMRSMFQGMAKMANLDVSSFDTKLVTDMAFMFYRSLLDPENSVLDLSSFDTRNVTETSSMLAYTKVKTIYASANFVNTAMTNSQDMFKDNTNLVGGNGTSYSESNPKDKTYARLDAAGVPGYFSLKP